MLDNQTFLAFIPARGGSKRLPSKNMKKLAGKPLIYWVIKAAKESKIFDKIVVSSDDAKILEYADSLGVLALRRPEELSRDDSAIEDALAYHLRQLDTQYNYVQIIEPTTPLLTPSTIREAAKMIIDWGCDVLISLIPSRVPAGVCKPIPVDFHKKYSLRGWMPKEVRRKQSQQLEPCYQLNGYIYILKHRIAYHNFDWWESDIRPFIMHHDDSIDIDDKWDWKLAEFLLQERLRKQNEKGKSVSEDLSGV